MSIPGLGGILQARQLNQQSEMQQLGQLNSLVRLQQIFKQQEAQEQALQKERQFRGEIAQAKTPEEQLSVASRYMGPDALGRVLQGSMDRKASLEARAADQAAAREQRLAELTQRGEQEIARIREQERERRITKEEADNRERATREFMMRLTSQLRPAPQPRNLQLTTDAQGNQLIVNPDGTTRPLTTQNGAGVQKPVAADRPMTEFQGKASLYGTRAAQSDKILKTLEEKISLPGLEAARTLGRTGNYLLSSEQQRVDQAQRDFVNAVLRQESGAVISDAEFDNAKRQYFPQPGDDAKTIEQKRKNRKIAIDGFKRMAGPRGGADIDAIIAEPLLPSQPTNTASGAIGPKRLKFDANGNLVQ